MAKFEIVPGLIYADRREWVTNTVLPRLDAFVPRSQRTHVFIHHTVTPDADSTSNEWETEAEVFARMRALQVTAPTSAWMSPTIA